MEGVGEPVRVRGDLDAPSRWTCLVKWCVLAAPHYPILILLYLAYPPVTMVAGIAILFTGRYPRPLFDFNVGVLRWSWRVMNYRFPMNGTDRYPPFTLASRPDYPADLEVDYPERLSRWAVLVKWWLLGLPQILLCWAMEPFLQVLCVQGDDQPGHVRPAVGYRSVALPGGRVRLVDARRVSAVPTGFG
jgi:uncharacterized protein DUF4389